jgi:hypothetical protein
MIMYVTPATILHLEGYPVSDNGTTHIRVTIFNYF